MVKKVKLNNHEHIYGLGFAAGLQEAQKTLEAITEPAKSVPGFALAFATVKAAAAERYAYNVSRNLAFLAKNGVDIASHKTIGFDPIESEFHCEFYDQEKDPELDV